MEAACGEIVVFVYGVVGRAAGRGGVGGGPRHGESNEVLSRGESTAMLLFGHISVVSDHPNKRKPMII